ncbi:phage holin family protein [Tumebacillus flagellatus]|uniref:Holin n=1 Tax=Tumebacillus flagellatus TaxID=1157490 RepID=A0A074LNQ9_9BACL|nr:phage holin family protein [Tumebacillus flagellatus]KEO81483.1 hypothetical protein EL26_20640 [Tumebacillus flagellatus]
MFKSLHLESLWKIDTAAFAAVGAIVGSVVDKLYGPDRLTLFLILVGAVVYDWFSGTSAAKKDKTYSSEYGIEGVKRTLVVLSLPAFANLLDKAFSTPGVLFYGVWLALLYHTWQSFTANSARAGWGKYIPPVVLNLVGSELLAKTNRSSARQQAATGNTDQLADQTENK